MRAGPEETNWYGMLHNDLPLTTRTERIGRKPPPTGKRRTGWCERNARHMPRRDEESLDAQVRRAEKGLAVTGAARAVKNVMISPWNKDLFFLSLYAARRHRAHNLKTRGTRQDRLPGKQFRSETASHAQTLTARLPRVFRQNLRNDEAQRRRPSSREIHYRVRLRGARSPHKKLPRHQCKQGVKPSEQSMLSSFSARRQSRAPRIGWLRPLVVAFRFHDGDAEVAVVRRCRHRRRLRHLRWSCPCRSCPR